MPTFTSAQSDFGTISAQVGVRASVKALWQTRKRALIYRFAYEEPIPKGNSTTLNFRRYMNLTPALAPIQGSITPEGEENSYTDIQSSLRQYGKWVPQPKHIADTIQDSTLSKAINTLSFNMRDTYETVDFNILRMGSNVFYPEGTTSPVRSDVGTGADLGVLTLPVLRDVVENMEGNDVEPITDFINPNPNVDTSPVEECYIALFHTDLSRVIRDLPGFETTIQYPSTMDVLPGELGRVENVRFVRWNYAKPWKGEGTALATVKNTGGNADVYPVIVLGKEAFGQSKLEGTEFNKVLVANAEVNTYDPLGQRGTAGWIGWHTTKILEQNYMARIECTSPLS